MASSKRKGGLAGGGPSTKKFGQGVPGVAPVSSVTDSQMNGLNRKPGKSNNRREWMKECLRLLEQMIDLPDAKPFREPVDCLKYPDFYAQVEDPIDFSKVMLKFRGGQYQDPFDFEKDVNQLFADYKGFFKDPNTEVYAQTYRLCFWFETEFRRILDKYGEKLKKRQEAVSPLAPGANDLASRNSPKQSTSIMVSINSGSCTIVQSPERSSVPALLTDHMVPMPPGAWHQSTKNYQVVHQAMAPLTTASVSPTHALHPPFSHPLAGKELYSPSGYAHAAATSAAWLEAHQQIHAQMREFREKCAAERRAGFSASRTQNTSFEMTGSSELHVTLPANLYTRSLDRDPRLAQQPDERPGRSPLAASNTGLQQLKSASLDVTYGSPGAQSYSNPYSPQHEYATSQHSASLSPRRTPTPTPPTLRVTSPTVHPPPPSGASLSERAPSEVGSSSRATLVGMKLDVCNVWLGNVRGKTTHPILLHEQGMKIPFYYRDKETQLHIKVDEIVRCLGHLGKNKKHTILIFVTPSCVTRIERRVQVHGSGASLIALFLSALSVANISRLLHTFHNMGKHSMFGPSLFSEVDQPGILRMLANIKPDIVEKLKNSKLSSNMSVGSDTSSVHGTGHGGALGGSAPRLGLRTGVGSSTLSVPDTDNLIRSRSLPESNERPAAAVLDQEALDLSTARPGAAGLFSSGSIDHPAHPINRAAASALTGKAYKPKFHFRSNSHLVRQHSTTTEPHCDSGISGMGSSSEESSSAAAVVLRRSLLKIGSADSSGESVESVGGSDLVKKEEAESDLELDYDEEEMPARSAHSVLLVVDSNDEELDTINLEEEEMEHDIAPPVFRRQDAVVDPRMSPAHYSSSGGTSPARQEQSAMDTMARRTYELVRNPHCGHAYEKRQLLQLLQEAEHQARCPAPGCSNDQPLRLEEMIYPPHEPMAR